LSNAGAQPVRIISDQDAERHMDVALRGQRQMVNTGDPVRKNRRANQEHKYLRA
jgi:NAD(P)-dependent dehydrogenase (short-subunit alcohol dehydrogenase family)